MYVGDAQCRKGVGCTTTKQYWPIDCMSGLGRIWRGQLKAQIMGQVRGCETEGLSHLTSASLEDPRNSKYSQDSCTAKYCGDT